MRNTHLNAPRVSPGRLRVILAIFACVVLAGLPWIALAEAGSKSQKGKNAVPTVTESAALPVETAIVDAADGGINPTNVAVTSEDLFTVAAVTDYDVLLGADQVRDIATGRGITVAVLDGGFNVFHPAIVGNVRHELAYDALDEDDDVNSRLYVDDDELEYDGVVAQLPRGLGHGTFVSGMVLKTAPDASLLPVRVADDYGDVWSSAVVRGIVHAVENGAHVLNLSVEFDELDPAVTSALKYAAKMGVIIVTSAGNSASDGLQELAASGQTIAVGATDCYDCVADFSNTNDPWEWDHLVFAPGVDLHGPSGFPTVDSACVWSGTSFSAGLVSGAMALALEVAPTVWSGDLVYALLTSVASAYGPDGKALQLTGRLDLVRTVKYASAMNDGVKIAFLDSVELVAETGGLANSEEPVEIEPVVVESEPVVESAPAEETVEPVTTTNGKAKGKNK